MRKADREIQDFSEIVEIVNSCQTVRMAMYADDFPYIVPLTFGYDVQAADVVERNNVGSELVETSQVTGNALIELGRETILAEWNLEQEVEQTIGMPFLMEIPILKYLFSTTTTSTEKSRFYLAVTVEMLNTADPAPADGAAGELIRLKQKGN